MFPLRNYVCLPYWNEKWRHSVNSSLDTVAPFAAGLRKEKGTRGDDVCGSEYDDKYDMGAGGGFLLNCLGRAFFSGSAESNYVVSY